MEGGAVNGGRAWELDRVDDGGDQNDAGSQHQEFRNFEARDERRSAHGVLLTKCPDTEAWAWMHFSGSAKLYLDSNEEAIAWFHRAIEVRRDFPLSHFWLVAAPANLGRLEEARTEAQVGLELDPTFTIRRFLDGVESDNPVFLKQRARHADAMRKAGIPEE
jgi:hypothetical protein